MESPSAWEPDKARTSSLNSLNSFRKSVPLAWGVWRNLRTSACRSAISERTSEAGAVVEGSHEKDASMALMISKAAGVVAVVGL